MYDIINSKITVEEVCHLADQIPQGNNRNIHAGANKDSRNVADNVEVLLKSIVHATGLFFVNLPIKMKSRITKYIKDRKNLPKRKSMSRVYVLIGYTSKEKVDRRYRSLKIQRILRFLLILGIIFLCFLLAFRAITPMLNFESYKKMFGIEEFDDLTAVDPFENIDFSQEPSDPSAPSTTLSYLE